jgi:hypothetical protein
MDPIQQLKSILMGSLRDKILGAVTDNPIEQYDPTIILEAVKMSRQAFPHMTAMQADKFLDGTESNDFYKGMLLTLHYLVEKGSAGMINTGQSVVSEEIIKLTTSVMRLLVKRGF